MPRSTVEINKIIKKTINLLKDYIAVDTAYLFGSYANGHPHKYSDIDLAIFSPSVNKMSLEQKINLLAQAAEKIDTGVEIHLFSKKCLRDARPTNFYGYILKTGKRIH